MDMSNQLWLEDLCLRLLCVLALDRFGDFVADEVRLFSILYAEVEPSFLCRGFVLYEVGGCKNEVELQII